MSEERISGLDGLRGLACLIVTVLHCLAITTPDDAGELANLIVGIPKIGVWLFFSLSAFLLTLHFNDDQGQTETVGWYFTKRMLRIAPAFAVALFLYSVTGLVPIDVWMQALRGEEAANLLHLWTVPVEISFYLVLPAVLIAARKCRQRFGSLGTILPILLATTLCAMAWPPSASPPGSLWVGWYAINFLSGVAAAILCQTPQWNWRRLDGWASIVAVTLIVMTIVASKADLIGNGGTWLVDKHYFFGPLWSVVIYATYNTPRTFINCRPLIRIGQWSYSIYLFHWLAALAAAKTLPPSLAFPAALAASIMIGAAGWWAIELPVYTARSVIRRHIST